MANGTAGARAPRNTRRRSGIRESLGSRIFDVADVIIILILMLIVLVPLLHVLWASFSKPALYAAHEGLLLWPEGFSLESIVTAFLFSFNGYFNGHDRTLFIMVYGIAQTFLVRLPFAYWQSIQPNASLTRIGSAAPLATCFGIVLCLIYFAHFNRQMKQKKA